MAKSKGRQQSKGRKAGDPKATTAPAAAATASAPSTPKSTPPASADNGASAEDAASAGPDPAADAADSDDDEYAKPGFSFFGASADVELSDSDENGEGDGDADGEPGEGRGSKRPRTDADPAPGAALPSVASLFNDDSVPTFLQQPAFAAGAEVHSFDRRAKAEDKPKRWLKKSQTVEVRSDKAPPPVPATGFAAEVQKAAMMNSLAYKDTTPADAPATVPISELNKKKKKVPDGDKGKSFAVKEKRKRDLGMSARGKSTVEEEKRVLRQEYASSGLGFD